MSLPQPPRKLPPRLPPRYIDYEEYSEEGSGLSSILLFCLALLFIVGVICAGVYGWDGQNLTRYDACGHGYGYDGPQCRQEVQRLYVNYTRVDDTKFIPIVLAEDHVIVLIKGTTWMYSGSLHHYAAGCNSAGRKFIYDGINNTVDCIWTHSTIYEEKITWSNLTNDN